MKRLLLIFSYAFALNWIWENLHSYLYFHPNGEPITQYMLLRATLFDAIFITVLSVFFLKIAYFRERKWHALIFGFIAAFFIEKYALETGRWVYNSLMPIIPLLQTGLTPTIQLGILSYVVFSIVDRKNKLFQCPECGLHYRSKEWAEKCEAWCLKHKSCNLEITSHAIENPELE